MPYNITGAILNAVADAKGSFVVAVLMMQKEVAERIQAQPGDSDRGSLSVFLQALFDIQKVASAPKGAFMPPPKVDSTVLAFRPKETGLEPAREKLVLKIVRSGFCQPRKTVANNLMTDAGIDRASTVERLKGLGLPEGARPHQLTWQQWIGLTP
jgi:16S rRNA (adenine1518-N6/adenine1519-N6)-dimethyltransferase